MHKNLLLITLLAAWIGTPGSNCLAEAVPHVHHHPLANDNILSIVVDDDQLVRVLMDEGLRPLACRPGPGVGHWLANDSQLAFARRLGMPVEVLVDDVPAHVEAERRANEEAKSEGAARGDWYTAYHTFEEIHARLDGLIAMYPDHVHAADAGASLEGRDIRGVRIGTGEAGSKPALLFNGCQHAREWVATMVPTYAADELAAGYGSDARITALLQLVDVYIIPVVNPDGYYYTYASGGDRFWRKNRRNNGTGCYGVDLNRNWGVDWNGSESTSENTCSDIYVGSGPFSEPESAAMRDFILARPNIVGHIDFHSYAEVILQPWAYTNVLPPDHDEIDALGEDMSQAILGVHGTYYPHGGGDDLLYLASGVFPDWTYGETGAFGYTIELRGTSFELPASQIRPTCEENLEAVLAMMEWAGVPLDIEFPDGLPTNIHTQDGTTFSVRISGDGDPPATGGVTLNWSYDGSGNFNEGVLENPGGGNDYIAELPSGDCDDTPAFYIEVETISGGVFREPATAPDDTFTAGVITSITTTFEDDGQTDPGWTVSGDATDGQWSRGVPAGGGDRGDPPNDGDGSGACWLTDNVDGNSDVDGGSTILTSPQLDAGQAGLTLSYWRWFSNNFGAGPDEDSFLVDFSNNNGVTWYQLEVVAPDAPDSSGGWYNVSHDLDGIPGFVPGTEFRLRFTAEDLGQGSVVEAGIDGVLIEAITCDDGNVDCPEDCAGNDGIVNVNDLLAVIAAWGSSDAACDINDDGVVDVNDLLMIIGAWGDC